MHRNEPTRILSAGHYPEMTECGSLPLFPSDLLFAPAVFWSLSLLFFYQLVAPATCLRFASAISWSFSSYVS